ncbi:MAG TPA: hypothetical protein VGI40_25440 [Pirellulaceae bacterium]|jgi:hypothetical protein
MLRNLLIGGALAVVAAGCGGSGNAAAVSGIVTLDGKPAPDVAVTFNPVSTDGNNVPGPSAFGVTGADGRYSLKLMGEEIKGATVGKNIVRFSAYVPTDPNVDGPPKTKPKTNVPSRYWSDSSMQFDVPPKGTKTADFDLKSP